jgi:hypothetical protein
VRSETAKVNEDAEVNGEPSDGNHLGGKKMTEGINNADRQSNSDRRAE